MSWPLLLPNIQHTIDTGHDIKWSDTQVVDANQLQATHTERQKTTILTFKPFLYVPCEWVYLRVECPTQILYFVLLQVCSGTDIPHFLGKWHNSHHWRRYLCHVVARDDLVHIYVEAYKWYGLSIIMRKFTKLLCIYNFVWVSIVYKLVCACVMLWGWSCTHICTHKRYGLRQDALSI